ncbi:hypothetical protein ES703_33896 [subsurface metagenome]
MTTNNKGPAKDLVIAFESATVIFHIRPFLL